MNCIVFEGADEVLIVSAAKVNAFIQLWFLEGQRNMDEYDVSLVDIDDGFTVTQTIRMDDATIEHPDFDVTELMPHALRQGLIDAELLTDE